MTTPRRLALLLGLAALIAGSACSSKDDSPNSAGSGQTIEVTLSDAGCEPFEIEATAGPTTFKVKNSGSSKVTEFEIMSGSEVKGEVENVSAGIERSFSITLEPRSYVTYCPHATKEKGTLVVAESGSSK